MIKILMDCVAITMILFGFGQSIHTFNVSRRVPSYKVRRIMKHLRDASPVPRSDPTLKTKDTKYARGKLPLLLEVQQSIQMRPWVILKTRLHVRAMVLIYASSLLLLGSFSKALLSTSTIMATLVSIELLSKYQNFNALKKRIRFEQSSFFDQLSFALDEGRSFNVAFLSATEQVGGTWSEVFKGAVKEISNGSDLRSAILPIANIFELSQLRLLCEMTRDSRLTSEIPQIVRTITKDIKDEIYREHLTVIEKRTQLVWIPVSVAILIPGTLLLLIPLFNSLKLLSNI